MNVIECSGLSKKYGKTIALNNVNVTIEENKITGLIGRNGAGKTTLLKILAGYLKETSGEVKVFSNRPFNNLFVSANSVFIDDQMSLPESLSLAEILEQAGNFYENWDNELAQRLFEYFQFHPKQRHSSLSKGKRSIYHMIIGLSARCALTIFDEPTTGMDVVARTDFYRALLKEYIAYPRSIIISSHHVDEMEEILENILLIKEGTTYLHAPAAEVKELAIGIKGKSSVVNKWVAAKEIYYKRHLGDSLFVVVNNDFPSSFFETARLEGLKVMPVSLSDICMYITNDTKGGIDDVFDQR